VQIKSFLYSKYPKLNFKSGYQNKPLGLIHAISIGQQFAMSTNQLIFLSDTMYLKKII
jgi:dTDP-glucose pyrophosphorylase